jgi:hypothetical protein
MVEDAVLCELLSANFPANREIYFVVGTRSLQTAKAFMEDRSSRIANRLQLKIVGRRMYLQTVECASGNEID